MDKKVLITTVAVLMVLFVLVASAVVYSLLSTDSVCPPGTHLSHEDNVWVYEYNGETRHHPVVYQTCEEN